jgi:glycosyltransferase involved in cell wall biosynthesis
LILTADLRMYRHSGIGRYLRNLFPLLLPQLHAGEIHVLAPRELLADASWLNDPRIRLIETDAPIYSLAEQRLLSTLPNDRLLWVPHFNAPLRRRGPMVVTIHDIAPLAMPQILSNPLKRAYARLLIQRAVSQADAILCASNFTRSEILTRLKVPAAKMTVTPLGLDAAWPTSAPPHIEPDGTPYLLYVGNVKPNKNLSLLLSALTAVRDRIPHRLLIAGKTDGFGTNDEAVLTQAKSLGDRARFTGEVSDTGLQSLYAGASALVLPSVYEGFGLPLLEAMSLNCPILSSTAGSLPEIAGDAALYFNPHSPEDLAARLLQLEDPITTNNLRALGRARLQHFSFQTCATQSATVMNRLLNAQPLGDLRETSAPSAGNPS